MIDICFVILNYNLYEETIDCVKSIRNNIDTKSYYIIIVDNGSTNDACKRLTCEFSGSSDVEIIKLDNNLGFARGNNKGISRAREIGAAFVCCINDDAELLSKDFFRVLNEKYEQYHAALIGPKVINAEGIESGFNHAFHTIDEYKGKYKKLLNGQKQDYYPKLKTLIKMDIGEWIYKLTYKRKHISDEKEIVDQVLQGSCIVFSPLFFEYLKGFNELTFLYYEEEFLFADLRIHNLHSLYVPRLEVLHKGGVATSKITGAERRKKMAFRNRYYAESMGKFLQYLEEHYDEVYPAKKRSSRMYKTDI